jgi:mono/diheme cytochrome c family protein
VSNHRLLIGILAAGVLCAPVFTSNVDAQANKPKGDAKTGMTTFKAEGCTGCHKSKDHQNAGEIGPDLSGIAKTQKAEQIAAYIKKPKAGSIMPAFKGPQKALDDMTAYLLTQK